MKKGIKLSIEDFGATAIEYGLIAAIIAVATIATVGILDANQKMPSSLTGIAIH